MYILYGTNTCPYCEKAKQLLNKNNIEYKYHDISENKTEILNNLADLTNNQRTIPVIFNNLKFIGGYTQLENEIIFTLDDEF